MIKLNAFEAVSIVVTAIKNIFVPQKITELPKNYYVIKHVVVDSRIGVLIYDFDKRREYIVYSKT